ncbi:MAG: hypothetical protein AB7T14_06160 [Candidatus Methylacidiphilaceae bacterium]
MPSGIAITVAVEGVIDEAVVKRLIEHVGGVPGEVHGGKGKMEIRKRFAGYVHAARFSPWMVLVDLDQDADCAPLLRAGWLSAQEEQLCFRVAVRAVEAWLLADAKSIARFLRIEQRLVPPDPESLLDPKIKLVEVARESRNRDLRADIVPRPHSGRKTGPAYVSRMIEFVHGNWQPDRAAQRSESLRRAIEALRRLCAR